jgi:hypothetical protein
MTSIEDTDQFVSRIVSSRNRGEFLTSEQRDGLQACLTIKCEVTLACRVSQRNKLSAAQRPSKSIDYHSGWVSTTNLGVLGSHLLGLASADRARRTALRVSPGTAWPARPPLEKFSLWITALFTGASLLSNFDFNRRGRARRVS